MMQQRNEGHHKLIIRGGLAVGFAVLMALLLRVGQLPHWAQVNSEDSEAAATLSPGSQQQAAQSEPQVFVPFVQQSPSEASPLDPIPLQAEATSDDSADWVPFVNENGGFSILLPADWELNSGEWSFELSPLFHDPLYKMGAHFLRLEKPESEDLIAWLPRYFSEYSRETHKVDNVVLPIELNTKSTRAESNQYISHEPHNPFGGSRTQYYFTHGALVLVLNSNEEQHDILRTMAESLEFLPDAPVDLVELDQQAPRIVRTLEEYLEMLDDHRNASEAFGMRLHTGETPTEFLATLSEQARALYEDQLIRRARELELWDQEREAMASIPPVNPSEMDKTLYWELERNHCRWLIANDQLLGEEDAHTREFCAWLEQQEDLSNVGTPPTHWNSP